MILDIVSVPDTSLCRRYRKYVQLDLGAFAALVVYECHALQKYLDSSTSLSFYSASSTADGEASFLLRSQTEE